MPIAEPPNQTSGPDDPHQHGSDHAHPDHAHADDAQWCFAWFADKPLTSGLERGAALIGCKWPRGSTVSISFLDGTDDQMDMVQKYAEVWITDLANLKFSWQPPPATDIRISFRFKGSWSVLGTTAKNIPFNRPTMNFGWLKPDTPEADARRVILHEFGHALGLIHEHQNPIARINWNRPVVIAELSGPPNSWDAVTIENNMFAQFPPNAIDGTPLDPTSIMMYPLPANFTLDGMSAGLNADLSADDRALIKKLYP